MLYLTTLGASCIREDGDRELSLDGQRPKRLALLAYLAAARPFGPHRRDVLVGTFWPELDDARARASLRQALHGIRRSLGTDAIVSHGLESVELSRASFACDVWESRGRRPYRSARSCCRSISRRLSPRLASLRGASVRAVGGQRADAPSRDRREQRVGHCSRCRANAIGLTSCSASARRLRCQVSMNVRCGEGCECSPTPATGRRPSRPMNDLSLIFGASSKLTSIPRRPRAGDRASTYGRVHSSARARPNALVHEPRRHRSGAVSLRACRRTIGRAAPSGAGRRIRA